MTQTHAERVAANLRAEMARGRVTQSRLADALGLSRGAAQRRLTGETPLDVNDLAAAAELLGVPQSVLSPEPAGVSQ